VNETIETGWVPVPDGKLYYERQGRGAPVVLIHSGFLDRRMWDPQFASFPAQFATVRYDLRGHGNSTKPSTPYVDAEDLATVLDHLHLADAFLLGDSNGARVAAGLAAGAPDRVRGLVLVGGVPGDLDPTPEEESRFMDTFDERDGKVLELATAGRVDDAVEAMLDAWAPAVLPATREYLRTIARENFDQMTATILGTSPARKPPYPVAERLRHGVVPMLLLCGAQDHPSLSMMMGRFAHQLPHARYVEIAGADHTANLSATAEFDRLVSEFLQATPSRAALRT
jgi:pimeloyl-ACP methyl ester carboxylesterase